MASVVLENVTKVYAETVVAVDNMSIEIPHGEIVSLLGPSGCGKTTAMRLIAGLKMLTREESMLREKMSPPGHRKEEICQWFSNSQWSTIQ